MMADNMREWYQERYATFFLDDRIKKVFRILSQLKAQKHFLDIGCGDGSLSLFFKEALGDTEVYGIDTSSSAVESAKQKGINAVTLDLNVSTLPFENNFFEVVFAGEIIEHLFDPDLMLEEIWRVLAPGGTLVITTPNLACWHSRLLLLAGFQPYNVPVSLRFWSAGKLFVSGPTGREHIRFFTPRALRALLKEHHFTIKWSGGASTTPSYAPFGLKIFVRAVEVFVARLIPSLATSIIIVATKPKLLPSDN